MKISLIIEDGPISRCYIKIFKDCKIKIQNLVYLADDSFYPNFIKLRMIFNQNNFWPLKFLKEEKFKCLIYQIEDYFDYEKGFCEQMYKYENINYIYKNLIISKNRKINSVENIKLIKNMEENIFINSGKQIYKEILDLDKKFIHIHPGDLPSIKGADASLWQLKHWGDYAVSCFVMNKKIDEGNILYKKKIKFQKFKFDIFSQLETDEIYRLWYSFFDPLLRGFLLRELIINKNDLISNISDIPKKHNENKKSNYYSFMTKKEKQEVFKLIFN